MSHKYDIPPSNTVDRPIQDHCNYKLVVHALSNKQIGKYISCYLIDTILSFQMNRKDQLKLCIMF